ncbi:beta-lactamase family protein [Niastella caeni]|uniref:Beta-lactamase family protein n=1 Tax=Niastella caeni TaxID=2569763 RepID=A0A4S8HW86_9BACT|nr:serine hydrolase domain-containing protein [Niastella caeni]THU38314.1 beta-lactamase family protein [Niastella caeni]
MARLIWLFPLLAFSVVCTGQAKLLHAYLELQHKRLGFNGTLMVSKNNQVLYQVSIGKASLELDIPLSVHAVFPVASISKQFTALLVALAAEEGRLHLNDSLGKFFPAIKDTAWSNISLHQLLSHTSGIPHNEGIKDYWLLKSRLPFSKDQALAEIFSMKLLFEPGKEMKYSSPGYFLLACILEIAYKQPYSQLLTEKIVRPLHLKNTGVYTTEKIIPGLVPGYHLLGDSLIRAPYRDLSLMKGSGDLYTSAEDLTKWNNSFSGNGVWSKNLENRLFTSYTPRTPNYGYGWFLRSGKRRVYYHGGGTFGCSALSAWYPDEQLSVVILSNVSTLPVNELWYDIEKIIFQEPFELPVIGQAMKMNAEELQTFTGSYVADNRELNILLINNQLYAKVGSNPPFELYPEARLKLYGKKVNVHLTFKKNEEGDITGLEAELKGQLHHFYKR